MSHYETLANNGGNGFVMEENKCQETAIPTVPETTVVDDHSKHKKASSDDNGSAEDVPMIEASYTTPVSKRTTSTTYTVTDNSGNGHILEYSDVNPSPPTPNKNEHVKVGSVRKGKRPESSDEYTDPIHNGVANFQRMKASSVKSKSTDTSPIDDTSKQRRASESVVSASHRKDFEDWPIKSSASLKKHESDL